MIASSAGRDQIVYKLLAQNANVTAVNSTGQCALHYAASRDRYDVGYLYIIKSFYYYPLQFVTYNCA